MHRAPGEFKKSYDQNCTTCDSGIIEVEVAYIDPYADASQNALSEIAIRVLCECVK